MLGMDLLILNCGNGAVKMNNHHGTASLKKTSPDSSGNNDLNDRMVKVETEVAVILTKFKQVPTKDYLHSELGKVKTEINKNFIRGNDNLHTELGKVKTEINKNFIRGNDNLHTEIDKVKAEIKCTKDDLHSEINKVKAEINENFIRGNDNLHSEVDKVKVKMNENFIRGKDNLHSEINNLKEFIDKKWWRSISFLVPCVLVIFAALNYLSK